MAGSAMGLNQGRARLSKSARNTPGATRQPLEIQALFCPLDVADPFDTVQWDHRTAAIKGESGEVLFEQTDCEVPAHWTQLATNVVVSKYFYGEANTPQRERSVRQLIHRVSRTIADWGVQDGYFAGVEDGERFYRDLTWLCLHQHGAFNSPVWFNVGLFHQYGVRGAQCNWHWDPQARQARQPENPYEYPQGSACFIQSVKDDMEDIMELARSEAMLFKFGSGTGTDLSTLRSHREKLSGGGKPSGPLSFMRVYDQIAAVVKSGGKTRRAAKMQSLKIWHPDILEFIECKGKEEKKARILIQQGYDSNFNGEAYSSILFQNANLSVRVTDEFMQAAIEDRPWTTHWVTDPQQPGPTFPARELLDKMAEGAWFCGDPGVQYDTTINRWNTCPNSGRINASNPCVTGDTLVATSEGLRRIETMVGETPDVVGSDGQLHVSVRVIRTGVKPVLLLRTKHGFELRLTADHLVSTTDGDVAAGDSIGHCVNLLPGAFGSESLPVDEAELVGMLAVRSKFDDGQLRMRSDVPLVCRERLSVIYKRNGAPIPYSQPGAIIAEAQPVEALLRTYVDFAESAETTLTDLALQLDRPTTAALLRGIFTAAAIVRPNKQIELVFPSKRLLQQLQLLLLSLGIRTQVNCSTEEQPRLEVFETSRIRFEKEVGFIQGSGKADSEYFKVPDADEFEEPLFDDVVSITALGYETVYDLSEPATSHFIANGLVVHNCSEYMFLDNTACNLASINLMKFRQEDGTFDVPRFQAACRIYFIAQEILVDHASYPTPRIAENSHRFRPLGLGYSNLGSLIMASGLPYDSDAARGLCGAMTSLLHGAANLASAEMAAGVGPFDAYEENREPMLGVMQMHRDAVETIDDACPAYLKQAARQVWCNVLAEGRQHGFRNAQATVLAPTGTISFLMDCDTTGIEPDIALVKYKQLAGGGMLKIINQTVRLGLKTLGYDATQIEAIGAYIEKHDTVEGSPDLRPEHLPVFDCAFQPRNGTRSIAWQAHVKMMAAAQPFLSGAISKTVNMPRDTTPADIADAYLAGWRLGLKALAVYRDGSKESQPLNTSSETDKAAARQAAVPRRERLPDTRQSITHKFNVAGHEGYITVGLYPDGRPGELFITMAKEGSTIGGLMDCFGTAVSMSWQYGVPLEVYVSKFSHTRFEPMGHTSNPDIRIAKSIVDYIFRWLAIMFVPGYREAATQGYSAESKPAGKAEEDPAGDLQPSAPISGVKAPARPPEKPAGTKLMASPPLAKTVGRSTNGSAGNGSPGNGGGDPLSALQRAGVVPNGAAHKAVGRSDQFASFQVDAPCCDNCGAITVRNGNCYLCHNCGNSMGCS